MVLVCKYLSLILKTQKILIVLVGALLTDLDPVQPTEIQLPTSTLKHSLEIRDPSNNIGELRDP